MAIEPNPAPTPFTTDQEDCDLSAESASSIPRVWTVFTVSTIGLLATVASQIAVLIVLVIWYAASGTDPGVFFQDLPAKLTTPGMFIGLGLLSQLIIGAAAWIPGRLSPQPLRQRLGLVPSSLTFSAYAVIVIGSLLPAALGIYVAHLVSLVIPPDPSVRMLYEQMTWPWVIPFLIFISVAPGVMEEFLFRGYIQRRLLERWSPAVAITITSVMFGIFHVTPHAVPMAFIIGLWLGVIAWRTGSVYPGMYCHGFINGAWNVWQIGAQFELLPDTPPYGVTMIGAAIIVVCFLLSVSMFLGLSTRLVAR